MKPGYYLSNSGNLQIWYPLHFFEKNIQRLQVIREDGKEVIADYTKREVCLLASIFDFEFIGEL